MKFDIVEMEQFSGSEAHIYSIQLEGEKMTLLEQFFNESRSEHASELKEMAANLIKMGEQYGCRREFFKENEGKLGDGVRVYRFRQMRLYCLYYDRTAIFLGSGGYKPPEAHSYQEVPELNLKAKQMIDLAAIINKMIREKELVLNEDGSINYVNEDYEDY
jgi:hypothetical protein